MTKKINYIVAFTTGLIVGVFSWIVISKLLEVSDLFDAPPIGNIIGVFLPMLLAFYMALTNGLAKALLFLLGVYLATVFYPYFFGNGEQKHWIGLGAVMAFVYLFYAFIGALIGWIARLIYLRFFDKHVKQTLQKIINKTDDMTEYIPQSAYGTCTYTQKASHTGYANLLFAMLFAFIGLVAYIYPSPPLNPIKIVFLQTAIKWLGVCFILIALFEFILSIRLMIDKSAWHIVIDDNRIIYETPKNTREKSFSCTFDEIEKINKILIKSDGDTEESSSVPTYEIILKNGKIYPIFSGRNRINQHQFLDTLRARGVQIVERC